MTLQFEYAQCSKNECIFSYKNTGSFIRELEDTERKLYTETIEVPLSDSLVNCKFSCHLKNFLAVIKNTSNILS